MSLHLYTTPYVPSPSFSTNSYLSSLPSRSIFSSSPVWLSVCIILTTLLIWILYKTNCCSNVGEPELENKHETYWLGEAELHLETIETTERVQQIWKGRWRVEWRENEINEWETEHGGKTAPSELDEQQQ